MGYKYPVGDIYVSCSWGCHLDRNPPSSEAGTDYACGYGTQVAAPASGTVIDVKTSNSSATGRYVTIAFDDGRTSRQLHMSAIYVQIGYRVAAGAIVGLSGASGYGSDYYYGAHLHQTLWQTCAFCAQTIDFQNYVGGSSPTPTPDPQPPTTDDVEDQPVFVAVVPKTSGGTKSFLCIPAISGKPYVAIVLQGGAKISMLPQITATEDWAYSSLSAQVAGINKN